LDILKRSNLELSDRWVIVVTPMRLALIAAFLLAFCSPGSWADDDMREKAESGDAAAQFELAQYYEREANKDRSERRVLRDQKRAFDWYTRSAEQGYAKAQLGLSRVYFHGHGVAQDKDLAVEWQFKAADQGLAEAQYAVGNLYLYGGILEQDAELAIDLITKAANQHDISAQKQLGILYFEGTAVPQDVVQAHLWFSVAALNGDHSTQSYLPPLEFIMDEAQIDEARVLAAQWQADHMGE
jgi:TPR repeat protein